jgi:hypothetical protein
MRIFLVIAAAFTLAVGVSSAPASDPSSRHLRGSGTGAAQCGSGQNVGQAGTDAGPPRFSRSFLRVWFSMDASTDGFQSPPQLPISIEGVCGLPRRLSKQGDQLSGTSGIAVVASSTQVWKDGQRLSGPTRLAELDGADTVTLKARLRRPKRWLQDEDGNPAPTFSTRRIDITD